MLLNFNHTCDHISISLVGKDEPASSSNIKLTKTFSINTQTLYMLFPALKYICLLNRVSTFLNCTLRPLTFIQWVPHLYKQV